MPLGFERLNERTQRPNALINFIKPLPGPNNAVSLDYLNRIAAQCYPIMKANHLSVMSLEEYEPNSEFLGRNFNAGEIIQLVLKDRAGRWLGFKYVQMVMMHELAHCKQMNHSRLFWQVRNGYAKEMEGLWAKKYLGEGMWGRGKDLASGGFVIDGAPEAGDVPEHLCGGTYRRRGRKRKRGAHGSANGLEKPRPSYAERQQRRIARKFGAHGEGAALGDDEIKRGALEGGKWQSAKPRVANSKRGRELRAQAALARFGVAKSEVKEEVKVKGEPGIKQEPEDSGSETDWDDDNGTSGDQSASETDLIKVCGDEGDGEEGAQNEMKQLRNMGRAESHTSDGSSYAASVVPTHQTLRKASKRLPDENHDESEAESEPSNEFVAGNTTAINKDKSQEHTPTEKVPIQQDLTRTPQSHTSGTFPTAGPQAPTGVSACHVCSLENEGDSTTCSACAHVLRPKLMPNSWSCTSETCQRSGYLNAGDCGVCGICGSQRPEPEGRSEVGLNRVRGTRPVGLTGNNVLRWD